MGRVAQEPEEPALDRSEGFGERLLGELLDRSHEMPPQLIAPLVAEEVARVGGRDVSVLLQDYDQDLLVPLPGRRLLVGDPQPIGDSDAGRAFLTGDIVEVGDRDGVRMNLPLLDGSDLVGVLALTMDRVGNDDRRLLRRLAGLVADMLVSKHRYTDQFFQARRRATMGLAAEIQWSLLPPLSMSVPQLEVAGILEPCYKVSGDSFDYALNEDVFHLAVMDAMGHDLAATTLATVALGALRYARRADRGITQMYAVMDQVIAQQFGGEHFVTAQLMRLDVRTGHLRWITAGHPPPLLIRGNRVVRTLDTVPALPIGLGGGHLEPQERVLHPGDRVLCYTDGLIEERRPDGVRFGEQRLIEWTNHVMRRDTRPRGIVRSLSHTLRRERGGITSDDATLVMFEWTGRSPDDLMERGGSAGPR